MSSQPASLPGFFYDEAKKKYFKIIGGHQSTGAGYTADMVASKEHLLEKRKASSRQRQGQIGRLAALQNPIFGEAGLHRELDGASDTACHASAWAAGLEPTIYSRSGGPRSMGDVEHFVYDRTTGSLIYDSGCVHHQLSFGNDASVLASVDSVWLKRPSSMSLHSSRALLFTAFVDNTPVGLSSSQCYIRFLQHEWDFFDTLSRQKRLNNKYHVQRHPTIENTERSGFNYVFPSNRHPDPVPEFLSSAAGPTPNTPTFVLGHTGGFCFLEERDGTFGFDGWTCLKQGGPLRSSCMFRAVDWLNEKTVVVGAASGKVTLWDRRVSDGSNRIRHGSSITHCRKLDDNHIIVAGLMNKLHTYDLRFTNQDKSEPYTTYPGYENKGHPSLGFDITPEGSMIVAANDSTGVKLFRTATGHEVQIPSDLQSWDSDHGPSRCVKFVDGLQRDFACINNGLPDDDDLYKVRGPDVGQKLLVARGKAVVCWGW